MMTLEMELIFENMYPELLFCNCCNSVARIVKISIIRRVIKES